MLEPMSGSIRFDGQDLLAVPAARRAHLGIAHVPEGRQVFASMTVLENLEMGAYTASGRRDWAHNLARIYAWFPDRMSTRLNSSHVKISYAVFCLKKKKKKKRQ